MKSYSYLKAGLYAVLTAIVVVALTYLGARFAGMSFLPFDLFDWLSRTLPGAVITLSIDTMVKSIHLLHLGPTASTAKLAEESIAIVLFLILGGLFGIVVAFFGRQRNGSIRSSGIIVGIVLWLLAIFAEVSVGFPQVQGSAILYSVLWLGLILVGWGWVLARLLEVSLPIETETEKSGISRRQFLYLIGLGSVAVVVTAVGVRLLAEEQQPAVPSTGATKPPEIPPANASNTSGPAESPSEPTLQARFPQVPGTRPELTSNQDFYRIDIDTRPPEVDVSTWRLKLSGLVNKPMALSLDELRSRKAYSQVITLECISNTIGGDLISTARFTGIRFKDLLEEAGLQPSAKEIAIQAVDGFYESVTMEDAMDERTLLVYEMNGEPLPREHGYPLRIYIPNRFGMKQPKWIDSMQVIDHPGPGYWVDRGWSATAIVKTTSVIDTIYTEGRQAGSDIVPVGGIAYAGARGISKVEVQIDNGPWQEAELRTPPLSPLTWVQWRFAWQAQPGQHQVRVRAYDGEGNLQETRETPPHPNGASGIDEQSATVLPN